MARRVNGEGTVYRRADGRWEAAGFVTTSAATRKRVRVYGATRAEAHAKLVEHLAAEQKGIVVPDKAWRLGPYFDHWLPIVRSTKRPMTYVSYEMIVRLYLRPDLGKKLLNRLTVSEVQRYFDDQIAAGRSIRTVQKMRVVLSAALTRAQREELVVRNVARSVELPTWQRKEIKPWTADEVQRFLTAAEGHMWHPAYLLLALYGMRKGEVLGLRWQDIDFDRKVIHIRHQLQRYDGEQQLRPTKTHAGLRDLPLLPTAAVVLRDYRPDDYRPDELIFQSVNGNPVEGGNLLRAFERIGQGAGLPRITLHHLRHTAATLLKNTGVPARDAQLILGHAHINTTQQLYQHADLEGQLSALTQLQNAVATAGGSARCRQLLPSSPKIAALTTHLTVVAPPRLELGTQGSSGRSRASVRFGITGVRTMLGDMWRTLLVGGVAVNYCRQERRQFHNKQAPTRAPTQKMVASTLAQPPISDGGPDDRAPHTQRAAGSSDLPARVDQGAGGAGWRGRRLLDTRPTWSLPAEG